MMNHKAKEASKNYIGIIALLYIFKNLLNVVSKLLSFRKIFFASVEMDRI